MIGDRAIELTSTSPEQTLAIGRVVGSRLVGGELVRLNGPLGAGKTQFVKGLAIGLGVPASEPVVSPTFVLVREYAGRVPLFHLDAYRLSSLEELLELGIEEMLGERGGVVALEWADRFDDAVATDAWTVEAEHVAEHERRLRLFAPTPEIAESVREALASAEIA